MNKSGQFYIAAAFIIIVILLGLRAIYVSVNFLEDDLILEEVTNEIAFESKRTVESGIYIGKNSEDIIEDLKVIVNYYTIREHGLIIKLLFVIDNKAYLIHSEKIEEIEINDEKIFINIDGENKEIELNSENNLYAIFSRSINEENRVIIV